MKSIHLILILISLISFCCKAPNKSDKETNILNPYQIDIEEFISNVKTFQLSNIGKKLEYIPLQTDSSCLIREIFNIAFCDSFIFINDFNRLLEFRWDGSYVRQIGTAGRGPAEYIHIYNIRIDNNKRVVHILSSRNRTILTFDFQGRFISSFIVPEVSMQFIPVDSKNLMFYHLNSRKTSKDTIYNWSITDLKGNVISRFIDNLKIGEDPGFRPMSIPLYIYNDKVHFKEFGIDTLYRLNRLQKEAYAIFNFGHFGMGNVTATSASHVSQDISSKLWVNKITEDYKNIYLELVQGKELSKLFGVFNKQTSELVFLKNNISINDLDGYTDFWPKEVYSDTILVDYIDAFTLLRKIREIDKSGDLVMKTKSQVDNLRKNLTESSNPVIIVLR